MSNPSPTAPILRHAYGTAVTAQEAYDAFMNKRVLIVKDGATYEAIGMTWYDKNSAQTDTANVGYVRLSFATVAAGSVVLDIAEAGKSSLFPEQQG